MGDNRGEATEKKNRRGTLERFFFQNNQIPQTILLVSQGFETIWISNKSSAENSILICKIALENRV